MASNWFCKREGQEFGPFSDGQLRQMAASGQLGRRDQVRQQDMEKWVFAEAVRGLFKTDKTVSATNQDSGQVITGTGNGSPPPVPEPVTAELVPQSHAIEQSTAIAMPAGIKTARAILFIQGGLSLILVVGFGVIFIFMSAIFSDPRIAASTRGPELSSPSPVVVFLMLFLLLLLLAVLPFYAAYKLKKGNRGDAVVIAIISLLGVPVGTILGLVVLTSVYSSESTAWLKEQRERAR